MHLDAEVCSLVHLTEMGPTINVVLERATDSRLVFAIYGYALEHAGLRMLRRAARRGARRVGKYSLEFPWANRAEAQLLAAAIRDGLRRTARKPLEQSRVETVLRITRKECNRWTKDGRLPTSGSVIMSRASNLRIRRATYPPGLIAHLIDHPESIEAWRAADARRDPVQA
jgi:hypothetical protein